MDILPSGGIFGELQLVHETGYFSSACSLEEHWQQVSYRRLWSAESILSSVTVGRGYRRSSVLSLIIVDRRCVIVGYRRYGMLSSPAKQLIIVERKRRKLSYIMVDYRWKRVVYRRKSLFFYR